jgi:hypothetical protein
MDDNSEKKVTLINGVATLLSASKGRGWKRAVGREELFEFAENAVRMLKAAWPASLTDGLFRVDIFQTAEGKLVVNEFESLEADYATSSITDTAVVTDFLFQYWVNQLSNFV